MPLLPPAHIVALGARTVVGLRPETAAAAVRAGINRVRELPWLVDDADEPLRAAYDTGLPEDLPCLERMIALADHCLHQLAARLPVQGELALPLLLATPEPRPGFSAADEQQPSRPRCRAGSTTWDTGSRRPSARPAPGSAAHRASSTRSTATSTARATVPRSGALRSCARTRRSAIRPVTSRRPIAGATSGQPPPLRSRCCPWPHGSGGMHAVRWRSCSRAPTPGGGRP